jgi:hypothetical protein
MTAPSLLDPAHMLGQALSDGAGYGVASPDRVSQRKGYRHRELDTGSARSTWRSRSCARAAPTTPGQLGGVRDRQLQVLREYETHHNSHRPHRSLDQAAPLKPLPAAVADLDTVRIHRRNRVGGVIHEYTLAA